MNLHEQRVLGIICISSIRLGGYVRMHMYGCVHTYIHTLEYACVRVFDMYVGAHTCTQHVREHVHLGVRECMLV